MGRGWNCFRSRAITSEESQPPSRLPSDDDIFHTLLYGMPPATSVAETFVSRQDHAPSSIEFIAAVACLIWYCIVLLVCSIGYSQIWRHYYAPKPKANLDPSTAPHVTIIRPVKGLEPQLYDCLASTFRQDYPKDKLHLRDDDEPRLQSRTLTWVSIPVDGGTLFCAPGVTAREHRHPENVGA